MKKLLGALLVVSVLPMAASAQNVGQCGWGSKVFHGQSGIAPQVLAVTTNGTSGNQTFGITTGTSGCTQNGVVRSSWKTAYFIDANKTKLARDMSVGQGESLDALASLLGMENGADKQVFFASVKDQFALVFPSSEVTTDQVVASLRDMLSANPELAQYSANI